MNPGHALSPFADSASKTKLRNQPQSSEGATASAAVAANDEARSHQDTTLTGQSTLVKSGLSSSPDGRSEADPFGTILVADQRWRVTVNVSGAHLNPDRWR